MVCLSLFKSLSGFMLLLCILSLLALTAAQNPIPQNAVPASGAESPERYPYDSLPPIGDILSYGESHAASGACCTTLSWLMPDIVTFRLQTAYNETITSYASQQEQSLSPLCVVEPNNTLDVSKTVFVLSYLADNIQAATDCRFAVKGGGQNALAGIANINSGVVIDLHNLDSVNAIKQIAQINEDTFVNTDVVEIGGGASWGQVYQTLDPLGLSVTGGGNAGVGVGGLTLGGGVSPFSPKNGWACDNVVSIEIILAYGNWIYTNLTSYSALFLSLRGGGSNYGIVTRFNLLGFPMKNFWGGIIRYPISTLAAQTDALMTIANDNPYDTNASVSTQIVYNSETKEWSILSNLYYTAQPAVANPVALSPFTSIQPQLSNSMRVASMGDLAFESQSSSPAHASRQTTITGTVQLSASMFQTIFTIANLSASDPSQHAMSIPGFSLSLHFDPISLVMRQNGNTHGTNMMGDFTANNITGEASIMMWYAQYSWSNEEDDAKIASVADTMLNWVGAQAAEIDLAHPFRFLNYAGSGQQPFQSYGPESLDWLQHAAKTFDPSGVFQKVMPGGFKVFSNTPMSTPTPLFGTGP